MKNKGSKYVFHILFLITCCCLLTAACFTISYSTTGASIPVEAKTISIQNFQNRATYIEPGFAQQLTNAFKDYIESNTRLIVVNDIGDLNFEGTITAFETKPTAIVSGDVASQNRFTITINVKYSNYLDPDLNYESSFSRYEDYDSSKDFEDVKADLAEDMQVLLIEDIFNKAFSNW